MTKHGKLIKIIIEETKNKAKQRKEYVYVERKILKQKVEGPDVLTT